jgi:hypothetical protein
MDPQKVLRERYPSVDFTAYFRHLSGSARTVCSAATNKHHICPRKQFPEYEKGFPENTVILHIDDHEFAHKILGALVPEMKVNANSHGYCGLTSEQRKIAGRKGGLMSGARGIRTQIEKGLGVHAPGFDRSAIVRSAGLAAVALGHCAQNGRITTHRRYHLARGVVSSSCSLCQRVARPAIPICVTLTGQHEPL